MAGLARICKAFGGMTINGEKYVWDYIVDEAVPEKTMPHGSARRTASERKRAELIREQIKQEDVLKV